MSNNFGQLVAEAFQKLNNPAGLSRQDILKYLVSVHKLDAKSTNLKLKLALQKGVKAGCLKQSVAVGGSGKFQSSGSASGSASAKKAVAAKKSILKKSKLAKKSKVTKKAKKVKKPKVAKKAGVKKVTKKAGAAKKRPTKKVIKSFSHHFS
jgi:hypothetical protein